MINNKNNYSLAGLAIPFFIVPGANISSQTRSFFTLSKILQNKKCSCFMLENLKDPYSLFGTEISVLLNENLKKCIVSTRSAISEYE